MAEQGLIVVISGMPASGKTSLARRLAPVIGLPIVDKDVILEILFDALGTGDAEWRQFLSRSSDNVLRRIAQAHSSVILTSFWRHLKSRECGSPQADLTPAPTPAVGSAECVIGLDKISEFRAKNCYRHFVQRPRHGPQTTVERGDVRFSIGSVRYHRQSRLSWRRGITDVRD